ncbi:MAG: hypothetical protein A2Y34_13820 [Spirochaetes bacterium GWC1_27_15]|nr:MAG: hypothetical protein A2Z98_06500 [Spirochaetes bacterium GWB1_27_13]OHD27545.1 MAG: hypothetical protein A2Y34_13820 [Spirochaetes bacterium GWC1_27_15]
MSDKIVVSFNDICLNNKNGKQIFSNLNFNIFEGEKIFILGHDDKERSLIFECILGVIKSSIGKALILNKDVNTLNKKKLFELRKKIGYIYPQNGLLKNISIEENICLPLIFNSELTEENINKRLMLIYDMFKLTKDIVKKEAWGLANTLEKKILMARAIINKPSLLLIDEPTTYIEKKDINEIKYLIDKIIKEQFLSQSTTIIVTSEDMEWAKESGDKIILLKDGKIDFFGNSADFNIELYEDYNIFY